jgi:hypothetical protein
MRERKRVVGCRGLSGLGEGCHNAAGLYSIDERERERRIRRFAQGAQVVFEYREREVNRRLCGEWEGLVLFLQGQSESGHAPRSRCR